MGETYQKEQAFLEDTAAAWDPQSPLKRGEPFPAPEKQAPAEAKLVPPVRRGTAAMSARV